MSEQKKKSVWAIEDGEYSDYHVVGVFSTQEKAEQVQRFTGGEITEWILDPAVREINQGMSLWRVLMLRDGTTEKVWKGEINSYNFEAHHNIWRRTQAPAYCGTGTPDCLDANVWAKSEKHAVKIVNEIRAGLIAGNNWETK